jgi:putative tryptophan/tyrosine transport system permease protein
MSILYSALEFGLVYGLASIGIYLTLRIVDFPDLTVNGSFVLGAAVSSAMLVNGWDPVISTLCALCAGGMAGLCTALLNLKCKIQNLLAGIIVMIGLYSINLRIMGSPNIVLTTNTTLFTLVDISPIAIACLITLVALFLLSWILNSEVGLAIRASGQNGVIGESYGMSYKLTVTIVMSISNALVALSGALFSQLNGFADINMGHSTIVVGLASVIIGERISLTRNTFLLLFLCIIGTVIYQLIIALALSIKGGAILKTSDIYLITAILVVLVMVSKRKVR